MPSLKFLIDNMCANFTEESVYGLVKTLLAENPCTISDIARGVADKDRSLDIKSAQVLAEAAVETLAQRGDLVIQGSYMHLPGSLPGSGVS